MVDTGGGGFESAAGSSQGRFRTFDGLRAIAGVSVLITHAGALSGITGRSWLGAYIARGDVGVPIFFAISGFLLYRPFAIAHLEGRSAIPAVRFWRRRASRIFPAYWVALTFLPIVIGHRLVSGWKDVVLYYGLLQIYDPNRVLGAMYQAWSLGAELGFYLFLPLYAAFIGRRRRTPGRQLRVELGGLAVLYVISLGFRAYLVAIDSRGPQFTWTIAWFDVFALGMALAVVSVWARDEGWPRRIASWADANARWCWLVAGVAFLALANLGIPRTLTPFTPGQRLGGQFLAGIVAAALVAPAALDQGAGSRIKRALGNPIAVGIGLVSYSFYLWHAGMLVLAVKITGGRSLDANFVLVAVVGLVLTIGVSVISFNVIERPASAVGDQVPAGSTPDGASPSASL